MSSVNEFMLALFLISCFKSFLIVSPAIDFLSAFIFLDSKKRIKARHKVSFPDLAAPDIPIIG